MISYPKAGMLGRTEMPLGLPKPLFLTMSQDSKPLYRGSEKHKDRPTEGVKGTLCPEWAHDTPAGGYDHDPFQHNWAETIAHQLFKCAVKDPSGRQRRYATLHGIAFEAKPTADGSWHGYPIPWRSVPLAITNEWKKQGKVTRKQIRQHQHYAKTDIRWALATGDKS